MIKDIFSYKGNLHHSIKNKIKSEFEEFYEKPQKMQENIQDYIFSKHGKELEIVVSGETKNLTCYIISDKKIFAYAPFCDISENVIVKEFSEGVNIINKHVAHLPKIDKTIKRLTLPKIVLINTYIPDNYPVPRLGLGVAFIASYMRKKQKAEVYILDTQMRIGINDIINDLMKIKPDIIGISVPHAQTRMAIKILDEIYKKDIDSIIVAGNYIAASLPDYFFKKYPEILICTGEGENTLSDLCDYLKGDKKINDVCNLSFNEKGKIVLTEKKYLDVNELPVPALDTIVELKRYGGALTHEWSRGCFWKCTFCPRHHKGDSWRGISPKNIAEHWDYFQKVIRKFKLKNRIYVADEETLGGSDEKNTNRILEIIKIFKKKKFSTKFDSYTRVDQIYNPRKSIEWHIKRIKMWKGLKDIGLSRLFLGVESGSSSQLRRYGKGITPEDSVKAIRILSAIGIDFRFGFIMFDPLMNVDEIIENIEFLERKDLFFKKTEIEKNMKSIEDEDFIKKHISNKPVYSRVSYMLSSLEVLVNSSYVNLIRNFERKSNRKLLSDHPEISIGRMGAKFSDKNIEKIAKTCQLWIDRNFTVMYTIKSLFKVASLHEKKILMKYMEKHRELSHGLIKDIVFSLYGKKTGKNFNSCLSEKNITNLSDAEIDNKLMESLKTYEKQISVVFNSIINNIKNGEIHDTSDGRLTKEIEKWKGGGWNFLNPI